MRTKTYFYFFISLFVTYGCTNDDYDNDELEEINNPLVSLDLKAPDLILNDIAKGRIKGNNIYSIFYEKHNVHPFDYYFEYLDNSERIKRIIIIDPGYICEETILEYYYRPDKLIDKIESVRTNSCLDFEVLKTYHYNYVDGYLKSIEMENDYFAEENYFSYNPNGTISEMYTNHRPISEPVYGYQKVSYTYDQSGNVSVVTQEQYNDDTYDRKYTYTYDENENIFKGFFVIASFNQPSLGFESGNGPFFLSNNYITSIKKEYLNNDNPPQYEYFTTNYVNGRLMDYGTIFDYEFWHRYYITYY